MEASLDKRLVAAFVVACGWTVAGAAAAAPDLVPLPPETGRAWAAYTGAVRAALDAGVSGAGFVSVERGRDGSAAREALRRGALVVQPVETPADVPGGEVTHWRGAVLVPGARIDDVLRRLATEPPDTRQEDVVSASVLQPGPVAMRVALRVRRRKVITAVYDTEHLVTFRRLDASHATSHSRATAIAEIADAGTPAERRKTADEDRGFLWRWEAAWRYEQRPDGLVVECESLTLSRPVPRLLRPLVSRVVDGMARESMTETLEAFRARFSDPAPGGPPGLSPAPRPPTSR
ncbi:MAG: hypothetical protein AB7H88_15005 [Vicinamibacterales bacterium]